MEKKNDRNLNNISWNHAIRTTTLLTPKFRARPILWSHATHAKISAHATHAIFLTHAKILWTHATHAKISTTPPIPFFDPRQNFTGPRQSLTHTTHAHTLFGRLCKIRQIPIGTIVYKKTDEWYIE